MTTVNLPYHNEGWCWGSGKYFEWCKKHCTGEYKGRLLLGRSLTEWKFDDEKDALLFALTWVS